ncbi:MAG: DUF885 family protein [Gemmataceae bacterium]
MPRTFAVLLALLASPLAEAAAPPPRPPVPDLAPLLARKPSEAAELVRRYQADRDSLHRAYPIVDSPTRHERMRRFHDGWAQALEGLDERKLSREAQADLRRVREEVEADRRELSGQFKRQVETAPLTPFAGTIIGLEEARRRMEPVDPKGAAGELVKMTKQLAQFRRHAEKTAARPVSRRAAEATARLRSHLRHWFEFYNGYDPMFTWWLAEPFKEADEALQSYAAFLRDKVTREAEPANDLLGLPGAVAADTHDVPELASLLAAPASEMQAVIRAHQGDRGRGGRLAAAGIAPAGGRDPARLALLRKQHEGWAEALHKLDFEKLSRDGQVDYLLLRNLIERDLARLALPQEPRGRGRADDSGISGRPIGREALEVELAAEMIPYSPEQLFALAEREFAWCEAEMRKAARDMGFADWRDALEKVKTLHVVPGGQPRVIRDLAHEAVDYLAKNDLVTVPPLAAETWRMEMMSPRRQLVSPFFTGGEVISVAFPTNTMAHDAKLQSLRGNNIHFSRATVHHELIPGHHLQGFMNARWKGYRGAFSTPFSIEGWALYWEFILYDRGFPATPEDRVGFLFWRMHRCARILFSIGFHLGKMTPAECIELLVTRVGHERDNATAEVRRSFQGGYGPLYQAAYMLGGLQFRALHRELVESGKMSARDFHDAVLRENRIPVAMVRASLTRQPLTRDWRPNWKFYGDIAVSGVAPAGGGR